MSFPYNFRALPFWHTLESDGEDSAREEYLRLSLHVGFDDGRHIPCTSDVLKQNGVAAE